MRIAVNGFWHVDSAGRNADTKRNGGTTTSLKRTEVRPKFSRRPKVQCNLEVPTLKARNATLLLFS